MALSLFVIVLGIIGNVVSMFLFASPLPTFWRIFKNKDTQEFSALPYLSSLVNCLLWVLYGLPLIQPNGALIMSLNAMGCAFEIVYITLFLIYAPKVPKRKAMKMLGLCLVIFVVIAVITLTAVPKKHRQVEVGSICMLGAVIMYISPLSVLVLVVRTKSAEFLPIPLCSCVFLACLIWGAYGFLVGDFFIWVPNIFGVLAGIFQLGLIVVYRKPKSTSKQSVSADNLDDLKKPPAVGSSMPVEIVCHSPVDNTGGGKPSSGILVSAGDGKPSSGILARTGDPVDSLAKSDSSI